MYLYFIFAAFVGQSLAHSWAEQLTVILDGVFAGRNGYPRGYVARSSPGFHDSSITYLLPPLDSGRTRADNTDLLCAPSQRTRNQSPDYPRLEASPGSHIAIRYLENGHVTLPGTPPGKSLAAGIVRVFGTSQPSTQELLTDVLEWTADGSGGNGRGRLLTVQSFDDGRCYQINDSAISAARQRVSPNSCSGACGPATEHWCETDIMVPNEVAINSTYTVYWVWEWPTKAGAPGLPGGKDEFYTTCADLGIFLKPAEAVAPNPLPHQDPHNAAHVDYKARAASTVHYSEM